MTIFIGADHRGFNLKKAIKAFLVKGEYTVIDLGYHELVPDDDYPDIAYAVAKKVSENPTENKGILICGSGAGVSIVANRFPHVRAVLTSSPEQAKVSKNDDDTNILALPADFISTITAKKVTESWLKTKFSGEERHLRRVKKIDSLFLKN